MRQVDRIRHLHKLPQYLGCCIELPHVMTSYPLFKSSKSLLWVAETRTIKWGMGAGRRQLLGNAVLVSKVDYQCRITLVPRVLPWNPCSLISYFFLGHVAFSCITLAMSFPLQKRWQGLWVTFIPPHGKWQNLLNILKLKYQHIRLPSINQY